jgi:CheY-like chemotaxis protein
MEKEDMTTTRPPPKILFVHNGERDEAYIQHLTDAGLHVIDTQVDEAVATATEFQPDIIVLDFSANGDITALLKHDNVTKHIPIIALAALSDQR